MKPATSRPAALRRLAPDVFNFDAEWELTGPEAITFAESALPDSHWLTVRIPDSEGLMMDVAQVRVARADTTEDAIRKVRDALEQYAETPHCPHQRCIGDVCPHCEKEGLQ